MTSGSAYDPVKRAADLVVALLGLAVLWPVLLVVALAVRVDVGRPVLFRQVRPGLAGRPFTILKFRTMRGDGSTGVASDAARLTPLGRALRATSLDELPSLVNVVRGDMSFVGPRPLLTSYLPLYTPEQARRHEVRPGVTGLAQCSGRNALDWERRLELDVRYVDTRGPLLDARIVLATVAKVLRREGISAEGVATAVEFRGRPGEGAA